MTATASEKKRDRVFVEDSQIDTYRQLAGIGVSKARRLKGADLPPFLDLKDVFLMAVSMGVKVGRRTPIRNRKELTRTSYFSNHSDMAFLRAIGIAETGKVEVVVDESKLFGIAEEYANTGFHELRRRLLSAGLPLMNLALYLIEEFGCDHSDSAPDSRDRGD